MNVREQSTPGSSTSLIRDRFIAQTANFELDSKLLSRFPTEDVLIQSARRYYALLPAAATRSANWSEINKGKRRTIIREHLVTVCSSGSVTSGQVREVDAWLTSRESARERLALYGRMLQERYGRLCFVCGTNIDHGRVTVDHIFPLSKGGGTELENLILAHPGCNSSKGASLPGELMQWGPANPSTDSSGIGNRLRYLVLLRDDFTCTRPSCSSGLFSGVEVAVELVRPTGIACYDNIRTVCVECNPEGCLKEENTDDD